LTTAESAPKDYVPLAVSTVGFSVLLGSAIMTSALILNRLLVQDLPPTANAIPDPNQPAANVLLAGALLTLFVPTLAAYNLLAPIGYAYRRFGLAMVGGFGSILLSFLGVPVNEMLGLNGLIGFLVLSLLLGALLFRSVLRHRAP
jgi:hypothetical protein